jgi:formylglycine-generating enzyme required for sulfatase activity
MVKSIHVSRQCHLAILAAIVVVGLAMTANAQSASPVGGPTSAVGAVVPLDLPDVERVFDAEVVGGATSTFVDPIAACWRLGLLSPGRAGIDCRVFMMGDPQAKAVTNKLGTFYVNPAHQVMLTNGYNIQSTEVTQLQWLMVMREAPSRHPDSKRRCDEGERETYRVEQDPGSGVFVNTTICRDHPVENITYSDIVDFIEQLNVIQAQYTYRLPTEAEWEYAARGGEQSRYFFGDDPSELDNYAWTIRNSAPTTREGFRTHAVAQFPPNAFGLHDVHGNVLEFVSDFFAYGYGLTPQQLAGVTVNPTGPQVPTFSNFGTALRTLRGGSYTCGDEFNRSDWRLNGIDGHKHPIWGFRLVRTPRTDFKPGPG